MKKLVNELTPFGAFVAAAAAHFSWKLAAPVLIISILVYCLTSTD